MQDNGLNDIVDGAFEEVSTPLESARSEHQLVIQREMTPTHYGVRIGCAFCFRTLNPSDPDEALRASVQVEDEAYHQVCWQKISQPGQTASELIPSPPEPLRVMTLVGAPLYSGPINTMSDKPLGISDSALILDSTAVRQFTVRNNFSVPVEIDRRAMPVWAFVRFPFGLHAEPHVVTLDPGQMITLMVYPHLIRPDLVDESVPLGQTQRILLESRSLPVTPIIILIGLYGLLAWHVSAVLTTSSRWYSVLRNFGGSVDLVVFPVLTCFFIIAALILLSPGRVLWGIHTALYRLLQTPIGGIFEIAEHFILMTLDSDEIRQAQTRFHNPMTLLLLGMAAVATLMIWLALLLIAVAVPGVVTLLFLTEAVVLFFLLHRFGQGYGFDLIASVRSIIGYYIRLSTKTGTSTL
jgi:hypothetical protein